MSVTRVYSERVRLVRLLYFAVLFCLSPDICTPTRADEPVTGPYLRATVAAGAIESDVSEGIVFRIGLSFPYRDGGSTSPAAIGHLSQVFTLAPKPPGTAPVVAATEEEPGSKADLPKLPVNVRSKTSTLDDLLGGSPDAAPRKKVPSGPKSAEDHSKPETTPAATTPTLQFYDSGSRWKNAEACRPVSLLKPGEASALLDIQPFLPEHQPGNASRPAPDRAIIVYVRVFEGRELKTVRAPVRLELVSSADATTTLAATEISSGFFGIRLQHPRGPKPKFQDEASLRNDWYEQTQSILATRSGREFYSAPDASRRAQATRDDPIALQALLQSRSIRAGDTIWLLEGRYAAPAHQHSEPPPEIVKRDPVKAPDLPDDIGLGGKKKPAGLDDLLGAEPARKPKTVTRHYFTSTLTGQPDNPVIVRSVPGHRVQLEGGLKITGAHTWYWGFAVGEAPGRANSRSTATRVDVNCPGVRLINLEFHGHREGPVVLSRDAFDTEIHGCLIHHIGYWPQKHPLSEGFSPGIALGSFNSGGVMRMTDNIVFDNYGPGITFPTSDENSHNFVVEGNVVFGSGMPRNHPAWQPPNVLMNWHVPMQRVFFADNILHQSISNAPNVRSIAYSPLLGWDSRELVMRNNIISGGRIGLDFGHWSHMRVSDNTIQASTSFFKASPIHFMSDGTDWNRNLYISPRITGTAENPLLGLWGGSVDFAQWQTKRGFDRDGEHVDGERLPAVRVMVRPNRYEPHRAHVTVIGRDESDSFQVDLKDVLQLEQEFQVFDVHDLRTPLLSARYAGDVLNIRRETSAECSACVVIGRSPD